MCGSGIFTGRCNYAPGRVVPDSLCVFELKIDLSLMSVVSFYFNRKLKRDGLGERANDVMTLLAPQLFSARHLAQAARLRTRRS